MTRYARIAATGSALPSRHVGNDFFEERLETSDEWIHSRTGIRERRFAGDGETTASLSADAARRAFEAGGIAPEAIDLLVVGTVTPDRPLPSAAAYVQARLGLTGAAFDLNAACAGFVYGLEVAGRMVASGASEGAHVVGAETLSRVLDLEDRGTAELFGDGAGAAVVLPGEEPGLYGSVLNADGRGAGLLTIPAGGGEQPTTEETVRARDHFIHMPDGREVFKRAVTEMSATCRGLLEKSGVSADDVSLLVAHQANARIVRAVADRLGFDESRAVVDVERVGNTSAASVPIALDRAWRAGRLKPGDLVLTVAFGAGLTWGANLFRWTAPAPIEASA